MTALVTVGDAEITIELPGSTALPRLRRTVRIPLAAISSITTEPPTDNSSPSSTLADIAGPLTGARTGSIMHAGRHLLLAYTPGDSTITLELDRERFPEVEYNAVVLRTSPSSAGSLEPGGPAAAPVTIQGGMADLVLLYLGKAQSISVDEADQVRAELPHGNRLRADLEQSLTSIPAGAMTGDRVEVSERDYRPLYEAISSIVRSGVTVSEELARVRDDLRGSISGLPAG